MKKKLVRVTALFFALMLCFTILSRAAWQEGTVAVKVGRPESRAILHGISVQGKVEINRELAVVTEPDQRVTAICVQTGQRVSEGEVLFEIDTKLLEEQILKQQQEMEKQKLQIGDMESALAAREAGRANSLAGARENSALSTARANVQLSRAARDLQNAKTALKTYRQGSGVSQYSGSAEEQLEKDLEEKQEAYIQAQQELTTLQWKIELAVESGLNLAQGNGLKISVPVEASEGQIYRPAEGEKADAAVLELDEPVLTQAAGEELFIEDNFYALPEDSGAADDIWEDLASGGAENNVWEDLQSNGAGNNAWEDLLSSETENDAWGDLLSNETEKGIRENQTLNKADNDIRGNPVLNEADSDIWEDLILEDDTDSAWDSGSQSAVPPNDDLIAEPNVTTSPQEEAGGLSQEERSRLEREIRAGYETELKNAREKVETAAKEKEAAESALAGYQEERLASEKYGSAETERQLQQAVSAARDAYVDAAIAANEAAVTGRRSVASASLPEGTDSSAKIGEIAYEQSRLLLEKLLELKEQGGKITAPADALVTKIAVTTGEKTADGTAMLLADLSQGSHFETEISGEQANYIGTGDPVAITSGDGKKKYEDLPVSSLREAENGDGTYVLTVQLPKEGTELEIGAGAALDFSKKLQNYACCVPLSALHLDEKNQTYVLVPEEYQTIMGTEIRARKVSVTVLERNEQYAALAEGGLSSSQDIIVQADRAMSGGDRVRIADS